MASKDSLLTHQDIQLQSLAQEYGDRLQRLTYTEKSWLIRELAFWTESCSGMDREDWDSFHTYVENFSEVPESDVLDLMLHPTTNWADPVFAMPILVAIAHQIAEGIYSSEEEEE